MQRLTARLGKEFDDIKKRAMNDTYLCALFRTESVSDTKRKLAYYLPVKHTGLALPNPMTMAGLRVKLEIVHFGMWALSRRSPQANELLVSRSCEYYGARESRDPKRSQEAYEKSMETTALATIPTEKGRTI